MEANNKRPDWDELVRHVVVTLPDSFALREQRLRVLVEWLPESYFWRATVVQMLATLEIHKNLQLEFPDFFKAGNGTTNPKPSQGTDGQTDPNDSRR